MLTKEMKDRLRRAGEYQKKAILELLPESAEKHLEVIGGELREMFAETAACVAKECCRAGASVWGQGFGGEADGRSRGECRKKDAGKKSDGVGRKDGVRKVTIE